MKSILSYLQKLGKALMTPIAVMPAAAILLRLGATDVLNIPWMYAAGSAIFDNLALIFAIGIAVGLAEENNGVSAIAAIVGFFVLQNVYLTFNEEINMGVLAGIIVGIIAAYLYNRFKDIKVPSFLGFFGGKRFVPIITSLVCLVLGVIIGFVWPLFQDGINGIGNSIGDSGYIGAFIFGVLNRGLLPFGLHHVINSMVWFQFGEFTDAAGNIVNGDLSRFFALDPSAGVFMTGFFPIMMFGLPAACLAMIVAAKPKNRKSVTGMLLGIALTSFLTGITEPIEFAFMFLAPVLYIFHAVMTGISLAICYILGAKSGFGFSAGLIDYILSFNISTKPLLLIIIGLIFGVIYYFIFLFAIKTFNLPTPGRLDEEESKSLSKLTNTELYQRAVEILNSIGGKSNISNIDACITRIRLTTNDGKLVSEKELKDLGAVAVMKMGENNFQIVVGTIADPLVTNIKKAMSE
jgi:PTS system N-acetylglucosamine-specific IIC component